MGYCTFNTMLKWLEEPAGKSLRENRVALTTLANKVRQHFYLIYERVQMFMDVEECICIQTFNEDCRSCERTFRGITLPAGMHQLEGIIVSGSAISMQGRWRTYQVGVVPKNCRTETFDLGDGFCTERDFGSCAHPIKFIAEKPDDCGKVVKVSYYDENKVLQVEEIVLGIEYKSTSAAAIGFARPGGISLPNDLKGGVTVALCDESSKILSNFMPWETIPNYKRIRINGVADGDVVKITGSRRFHELYYDGDIVETDNRLAIEQAARGFIHRDSNSAEPTLIGKAALHFGNAEKYLLGEKARDEGGGVVRKFEFGSRIMRRSRLTRRGRC
jgi:hypothetical protein